MSIYRLKNALSGVKPQVWCRVEVVSKRLGHSGIAITAQRCLSVYSSRDAAAAEAFEDLSG